MRLFTLLGLGAWLWLCSAPAHALCLAPLCTCTISTTSVVFSSYDPLNSGNVDSSGNLRIGCGGTLGLLVPFNIAISVGTGSTYATRVMASGSNRLSYNLYTDSNRTIIWGDGTSGTGSPNGGVLLDALGLAPAQNFAVYGRIPGGQNTAVPGAYLDNLVITVTFD